MAEYIEICEIFGCRDFFFFRDKFISCVEGSHDVERSTPIYHPHIIIKTQLYLRKSVKGFIVMSPWTMEPSLILKKLQVQDHSIEAVSSNVFSSS